VAYNATSDGTVQFSGSAEGSDQYSGSPVSTGPLSSNTVQIGETPELPPVPTWPPEPYREPVNLTEVRGNADTILSLGEAVPAGDDPTLLELDYNGDGFVDVADAFDQFVDAGLLRQPSWTFDPDAASSTLMALQSVYGANLENFQPVEGRVWLLYMLGYLPYQ